MQLRRRLALGGLEIRCPRELASERITVVSALEEHAVGEDNTKWFTAAMPDLRVMSEE